MKLESRVRQGIMVYPHVGVVPLYVRTNHVDKQRVKTLLFGIWRNTQCPSLCEEKKQEKKKNKKKRKSAAPWEREKRKEKRENKKMFFLNHIRQRLLEVCLLSDLNAILVCCSWWQKLRIFFFANTVCFIIGDKSYVLTGVDCWDSFPVAWLLIPTWWDLYLFLLESNLGWWIYI